MLGEFDDGLAVIRLFGEQRVDPVLELGGDPPEGESGRGGRAGTSAAAEHGPATPSPEAHQCTSVPSTGPVTGAVPVGRAERHLGVGIDLGQDLRVLGRGLEQLGVGAIGDDAPGLQQDDAVGQADRREPVRHDQCRAPFHEDAQGVVDLLLDLHVDGTGGVVENQDGRIDEQGPGDGDALTLAPRQGVAAFAHHGVVALGQLLDETVCPRCSRRGFDIGDAGIGAPVGDVVPDRHREEKGVVEDHADVRPQALDGEVPDVVAVDGEGALGHVVETGDEPGHGGLARARPSHQGHRFARAQVEVEIGEHRGEVGPVGEAHLLEPHVAGAVDELDRAGPVDDGGLLVEDLVDALGRRGGALAHHDDHAQHHEGRLEHEEIGVEGQDRTETQAPVDDHVAAEGEDQRQTHLGQVLDRRCPPGTQVGVFDVPPLDLVGRLGQRAELLLLLGEGPDHPDPVDVLVDDGGHVGEPSLDEP